MSLKSFQGIFWFLYHFLLILEVKGGSKRNFFDCVTVHICECGENTLNQDLNPFEFEMCNRRNVKTISVLKSPFNPSCARRRQARSVRPVTLKKSST
ncbi:hypothetical protein TNCV_1847951 [Trichonephila clavipes]|nr:hypothetical protein TNCV_1847951 [Trichonephila clavipes]